MSHPALYSSPSAPALPWAQGPVPVPNHAFLCTADQLEDLVKIRLAAHLEAERKQQEGSRFVGPVEISQLWGITAQATRRILKREKVERHYPAGRKARALFKLADVETVKAKYTRADGTFKNTVRTSAPRPKASSN